MRVFLVCVLFAVSASHVFADVDEVASPAKPQVQQQQATKPTYEELENLCREKDKELATLRFHAKNRQNSLDAIAAGGDAKDVLIKELTERIENTVERINHIRSVNKQWFMVRNDAVRERELLRAYANYLIEKYKLELTPEEKFEYKPTQTGEAVDVDNPPTAYRVGRAFNVGD